MKMGRIVREACKKQEVSHGELARRLGVSQARIPQLLSQDWITGKTMARIAKALKMELKIEFVARRP